MRISDWSSDVCSSDLIDNLEDAELRIADRAPHDVRAGFRGYSQYLQIDVVLIRPERGKILPPRRLSRELVSDGNTLVLCIGPRFEAHPRRRGCAWPGAWLVRHVAYRVDRRIRGPARAIVHQSIFDLQP